MTREAQASDVSESEAVVAEVPSNIALVKYWGKRDSLQQWPANDSISMTLSAARTRTIARLLPLGQVDQLTINGHRVAADDPSAQKAFKQLAYLRTTLGFDAPLAIQSSNTFPADCGIASSASGLGALTLAAIAAWTGQTSWDRLIGAGYTRELIAALARRGSGSACRSFFGGFVRWHAGHSPETQSLSVLASPDQSGPWELSDVIVIISDLRKAVTSTQAHAAAWSSPLFAPRLAGLDQRLKQVEAAIAARNLQLLGDIIESEALEMHAVAMSAEPSAVYMSRETSEFLAWVRARRSEQRLPAWFTLDAGPNPHLICTAEDAQRVADLVHQDFGYRMIIDTVGTGPTLFAAQMTANIQSENRQMRAVAEDLSW